MSLQQTDRYDDIINLPHHRSCTRPHMSMHNRAAQFMPFAALTGYDDIIKQTATHSNEAVERANTPVNLAEATSPPNMRRRPKKRLFGLTREESRSNQTASVCSNLRQNAFMDAVADQAAKYSTPAANSG